MSRGRHGEEADDVIDLGFDDDEPFTMVSSQLINDSSLRVPVRFTYVVLRSYKGREGIFPRQSTLAEQLGCDRRTVRRYLAELTATGWLVVTPQYDHDGWRIRNRYVLRNKPSLPLAETPPTTDETPQPPPSTPADSQVEEAAGPGDVSAGQSERTPVSSLNPKPGSTFPQVNQSGHQRPFGADTSVLSDGTAVSYQELDLPQQDEVQPPPDTRAQASRRGRDRPVVVVDPVEEAHRARTPGPGSGAALARAVAEALPAALRVQLHLRTVEHACAALAESGWTPASIRPVVAKRNWAGGRGGGLVVDFLRGLDSPLASATVEARIRSPWCGQCDDEHARFVPNPVGSGVIACPRCGNPDRGRMVTATHRAS